MGPGFLSGPKVVPNGPSVSKWPRVPKGTYGGALMGQVYLNGPSVPKWAKCT